MNYHPPDLVRRNSSAFVRPMDVVHEAAVPAAARSYQIVPSQMAHVYQLAARMRDEDRKEIEATGLPVIHAVRDSFKCSTLRCTAFVGPDIAAMWGLGGAFLSDVGQPWLLTTPAAERVPFSYLREGRVQVQAMLTRRRYLENYVPASYARACRFLVLLGFTLEQPAPYGPKGVLFHRFWMGTPPTPSKDH